MNLTDLLSCVAAPAGWRAVFRSENGPEALPIVFWAVTGNSSDSKARAVVLDSNEKELVLADERGGLLGYAPPGHELSRWKRVLELEKEKETYG